MYKDRKGKTQLHDVNCSFLGERGLKSCDCPKRLAAGTVESVVGQLRAIFKKMGRGEEWNPCLKTGNPAYATSIADYIKVVRQEHSEAHVTSKQAKPLFIDKLERVCDYLIREEKSSQVSLKERFILLRDRAFLALQYFAGDRAGDLSNMLTQEMKALPQGQGFVIRHTQGKGTSAKNPKLFRVQRCKNSTVCPVAAIVAYVQGAKSMGLDLRTGFLFRKVDDRNMVLETPVTYDTIYDALKRYLVTLGIYEGETPHSLRGGCAITMLLTGAARDIKDLRSHVGWRSKEMPSRYARAKDVQDAAISKRFSEAIDGINEVPAGQVEHLFGQGDYGSLPLAFP